jgi:cytochrome c5
MIRKRTVSMLAIALAAITATASMAQAGATAGEGQQTQLASPALAPTTTDDAEGRALFEANCSSCHEASDATSQAKDLAGWTETIEKMVGYGAPVATQDQERIAAYLAATYPAPAL